MKHALLLLPLALAACATPREACINEASRNLKIIDQLIVETRANLERGYAVEEKTEVRTVRKMCSTELPTGETVKTPCSDVETRTVKVPVAVDLEEEAAKLASLTKRREAEAASVASAAQVCQATYPE